jgi:hypothetical protein
MCSTEGSTKRLIECAKVGRIAGHAPKALIKEGKSQRLHAQARSLWNPSSQPAWLTPEFYVEKIQSVLSHTSTSAIAKQIGVSRWYAGKIRQGYRPHPRHWLVLAQLAGILESDPNKFVTIRPD